MKPDFKRTEIDVLSNSYGNVIIATEDNKYFIMLENWDSDINNIHQYFEINKILYDELMKFHNANKY